MGKKSVWWDTRYYAIVLFIIDTVSCWSIGLKVNYTKEENFPLVQLTLDQDSSKRPYEARKLMKTYRLKLFKGLLTNITEESHSDYTNQNSEEVPSPTSFETDKDSPDVAGFTSSLIAAMLNGSDETHNFHEKLPEDSQILLAASGDEEYEAAIFGTIVGQLARPLDQLLGGQLSSMILALNQTASSSGSSSQRGGQGSGQQGSEQSGGYQSSGGQNGQQGSSEGSQNWGGGADHGGGGGGTEGGHQAGGGSKENEEQQNGGEQDGQGGGGGGQGGGGQVQCIPSRALCAVFSVRQCCPGTACSVFPLGLLGPLSGPLSGPLGSLALGSCQPVVG